MGRLAPILFLIEFWVVIVAFIPALLAGAWFGFRHYLVTQNDVLLKYKPTIDTAALLIAIGSLLIGYVTLMREIEKLKAEKAATPSAIASSKRYQTKGNGYVNLRVCPKPNSECPAATELPPATPVLLLGESRQYIDHRGTRSVWQKVRAAAQVGWVNENTLWER